MPRGVGGCRVSSHGTASSVQVWERISCWGRGSKAGPLPTCHIDVVVQGRQGEAPLVVVGEVGERHPPLWGRQRALRVAGLPAVASPPPFPLQGCRNVPSLAGRSGAGLSSHSVGVESDPWRGRVPRGLGTLQATAKPGSPHTHTGHVFAMPRAAGRGADPGLPWAERVQLSCTATWPWMNPRLSFFICRMGASPASPEGVAAQEPCLYMAAAQLMVAVKMTVPNVSDRVMHPGCTCHHEAP